MVNSARFYWHTLLPLANFCQHLIQFVEPEESFLMKNKADDFILRYILKQPGVPQKLKRDNANLKKKNSAVQEAV